MPALDLQLNFHSLSAPAGRARRFYAGFPGDDSLYRQQGLAVPASGPVFCSHLDRYDNIYALLKKARSEAEADVGTTLLGAPDAVENRRHLDSALTQLQSTRASWISTYGGGHRVLIAAEVYQIFTTLEVVILSVNTAEQASRAACCSRLMHWLYASFVLLRHRSSA